MGKKTPSQFSVTRYCIGNTHKCTLTHTRRAQWKEEENGHLISIYTVNYTANNKMSAVVTTASVDVWSAARHRGQWRLLRGIGQSPRPLHCGSTVKQAPPSSFLYPILLLLGFNWLNQAFYLFQVFFIEIIKIEVNTQTFYQHFFLALALYVFPTSFPSFFFTRSSFI